MEIQKRKICLSNILQGGAVCVNPIITWTNLRGVLNPCVVDGNCIEVELLEGADEHCLTVIIDCDDCDQCPATQQDICFCSDGTDCPDCHSCNSEGLCVNLCSPEEQCCNGTCAGCCDDNDCPGDQVCTNGICGCPPGTNLCPDGKCKECCDSTQCPPCYECVDGTCVPIVCTTGVCDPSTGDCVVCFDDTHCGANECCKNNVCDCCIGFYRNPDTGLCEPELECFGKEDCVDPCDCCNNGKCEPCSCPPGQVCVDGDCVPSCCEPGVSCDPGYGCINCVCKPCAELSCDETTGEQCAQAVGCGCDSDDNCIPVDCSCDNVGYTIDHTPATPGVEISPGLPALQGTATITAGSTVDGIMNHTFNVSVAGATSGSWTAYVSSTSGGQTVGTGISTSFTQSQLGMPIHPFQLIFTETGTGRTAEFFFARTFGAALSAPDVWVWEVDSQGTPGQTSGGSPGSLLVCPTNADFSFTTPVIGGAVSGNISLGFSAAGNGCLRLSISGCGIWEGMIPVQCGGQTVCEIPFTYEQPEDGCCNPVTDPNCGPGTGTPCEGLSVVEVTLAALPYFSPYEGQFEVEADFLGAGLSIQDWFYLNPSSGCWDTTANGAANDIIITPDTPAYTVTTNISTGGCIRLGHSCELRISGCRKLQGELCLEQCDLYDVEIQENIPGTYFAAISLPVVPSYSWTTVPAGATGFSQTFIPPTSQAYTQICVDTSVTIGMFVCPASYCIGSRNDVPGCISSDPNACNNNPDASMNDGSCVIIGDPSYLCLGGLQLPSVQNPHNLTITYEVDGNVVTGGEVVPAGLNTLDIYIGGSLSCGRDFNVQDCWECVGGTTCTKMATAIGYDNAECDNRCGCPVAFTAAVHDCTNDSRVQWKVLPSGGSGVYTITIINQTTGETIMSASNVTGTQWISGPFCPAQITIGVNDGNCEITRTYEQSLSTACCDCNEIPLNVSIDDWNSTTGVVDVTITPDPCSTSYLLTLLDSGGATVGTETVADPDTGIPFASVVTAIAGATPLSGDYTVRLTGNGICVSSTPCISEATFTAGVDAVCNIENMVIGINPVQSNAKVNVSATVTIDSSHTVKIYQAVNSNPPDCFHLGCGDIEGSMNLIDTQEVPAGSTALSVNYTHLGVANIDACYAAIITQNNMANCSECSIDSFRPDTPAARSVTVNSCSFSTGIEILTVNWDSANLNADSVRIIVQQSAGASGDPCIDPIIYDNIFSGESGTGEIPVPAINGQNTEVTVTVFDGSNPEGYDPCSPSGAYDVCTTVIPSCSCNWTIVEAPYAAGQLQIVLDVQCPPALGDVEIHFDSWTLANCTGVEVVDALTPIVGITQAQADGSIIFVTVPQTASDQYFKIRLEDASATPGCDDEFCAEVPTCGTPCTTQYVDVGSNRMTKIVETGGDEISLTTGALFSECGVAVSVPNDDIVTAIESDLQNFDTCGGAGISVSWSEVAAAGDDTECLEMTPAAIDSGGSGSYNLTYTGITINATPYIPVGGFTNYITFTAGVPSIPAGAAASISAHVNDALTSEGLPTIGTRVIITHDNTQIGNIQVKVTGIDGANVLTLQTNRTDVPALVNTATTTSCTELPTLGGALQTGNENTNVGCVRFTVTGYTGTLDYLEDSSGDQFTFVTTGC